MTIHTTQKIIKIGSSAGVTLPARDLKNDGLKIGQDVRITAEPVIPVEDHKVEIVELTQKLITRHKKALENLNQR